MGYFDSKEGAISANKAARESMYSFSESDMTSPDQVKRNVEEMKKAASRFNSPKKKGLDSNDDELPTGVTKAKASGKWVSIRLQERLFTHFQLVISDYRLDYLASRCAVRRKAKVHWTFQLQTRCYIG